MKVYRALLLGVASVFFCDVACAQVDKTADTNMLGSRNVVVEPVSFSDLPDDVQIQVLRTASCAGDKKNMEAIKYYAYVSDYNRTNKLPPNYIVDYEAFKDPNFNDCVVRRPCKMGACYIVGYSLDKAGWNTSFLRLVYSWFIQDAPRTNQKAPRTTLIGVVNTLDERCVPTGGYANDGACIHLGEWLPTGLIPVVRR